MKRLYKKFATKEQYYFMFRDSRILDGDDSDDEEDKEESNKEESKDKKRRLLMFLILDTPRQIVKQSIQELI